MVERFLALMHDCRAVVPQLEPANVTELIPYMSSSVHYGKLRLRAQVNGQTAATPSTSTGRRVLPPR